MNIGLVHGKELERDNIINGFVHANYAGDLDKMRSQTGYIFLC